MHMWTFKYTCCLKLAKVNLHIIVVDVYSNPISIIVSQEKIFVILPTAGLKYKRGKQKDSD